MRATLTLYIKGDQTTYKHQDELRNRGAKWDRISKSWTYEATTSENLKTMAEWCRNNDLRCSINNKTLHDLDLARFILSYATELNQGAPGTLTEPDLVAVRFVFERAKDKLPLFDKKERVALNNFLARLVDAKSNAKLPSFAPEIDFSQTVYRSRWILDMMEKF